MPSVNEQLQDEAIRHAIDLMAHANTVVRRIIADLNFADPKLFAAITEALERVPLDEFTVPRLTRALAEARDINAMAYETVEAALNVELRELVKYEANYQATLFRAQMAGVPIKAVDFGAAYAAANSTPFRGRLMKEWAVSLGTDRMRRIEDALRIGYVEQKTVGDMVRTIRGTRAARYADGLLQTDRRNAEAIARTALSHYAGVTRDRFYEQNSDIIKEIVWLSVLDSRTTPQCVVRDGKHYTMDTDGHYRAKGHSVPWGEGPGRLHWNAVPASTPVRVQTGWKLIEDVSVGDEALAHDGSFRRVLAVRRKRSEGGIVRVARVESGRVLRATDDHPVAVLRAGALQWKFAGALEIGDQLFEEREQPLGELGASGLVRHSEAHYGPAFNDESRVALARTLKSEFAAGLDRDLQVRAREVEYRAVNRVLRDPRWRKAGECGRHHFLAIGQLLSELGRKRLGDLLALLQWNGRPAHALGESGVVPALAVGPHNLRGNVRHAGRVVFSHAFGVQGIGSAGLLGESERPVIGAARCFSATGGELDAYALLFAAHGDTVPPRVGRQAGVWQPEFALDLPQGESVDDVFAFDDLAVVGRRFRHVGIVALEVQHYTGQLYDLEVEGAASYVADGLVVSNCRSTSYPVTNFWQSLGVKPPPSTRASMDGQVPDTTTYLEWITKQNATVQNEVLGKTRGEMLRSGKFKVERFFNNEGRFLTLDELRARDERLFALAA